jgi:hypothetical protein
MTDKRTLEQVIADGISSQGAMNTSRSCHKSAVYRKCARKPHPLVGGEVHEVQ